MKKLFVVLTGLLLVASLAACGGGGGEDETPTGDCKTKCGEKICGEVGDCTCGACPDGETCTAEGQCEAAIPEECVTACEGKECGEVEGCNCGTCADPKTCSANKCVDEGDPCIAACEGKKCGKVGDCVCGECTAPEVCDETTWTCGCEAKCEAADGTAFECGNDGCGNPDGCGKCQTGSQWECLDNMCKCTPACDGKVCGGDTCGGSCGDCGAETCALDGQCYPGCPDPVFSDTVLKLNVMAIGKGGIAGEALDVDGDPDTCAPAANCENGLNNQLSGLLDQLKQFVDADAEIAKALDEGQIIMLAENVDYADDCTVFTINMYMGEAVKEKTECDFQAAYCEYYAKPESIDVADCLPLIAFDNAKVCDGKVTAGGPEYLFSVTIPIQEGVPLTVTANMAQMVGDVSGVGEAMKLENGIIGAAVRKDKIMEAVDMLPPEVIAELPVSIDMIKNLLNMFIQPDVDTDNDGELDGASIGIKFAAIAGKIIGMEPQE